MIKNFHLFWNLSYTTFLYPEKHMYQISFQANKKFILIYPNGYLFARKPIQLEIHMCDKNYPPITKTTTLTWNNEMVLKTFCCHHQDTFARRILALSGCCFLWLFLLRENICSLVEHLLNKYEIKYFFVYGTDRERGSESDQQTDK